MGNLESTVRLDALPALDASALPNEFRLFQFGDNPTSKGTFVLDATGADAVMAAYSKHGVDLHVDYEHDMRNAAAWFAPEIRADGLWAVNVRWTPRAAEMLKGREYRYFSPTFVVDDKKRITRLVNVALTNLPATQQQQALIAASRRSQSNPPGADGLTGSQRVATSSAMEINMQIGSLIGLKDDASEDAVAERVIALAGIERRLLQATGKDNLADAMTEVLSNKDAAAERDQLKKLCRDWEERHLRELADEKSRQISCIISDAIGEGRVSLRDTERLERWRKHGEDFGPEQLKKLVAERDPRPVRAVPAAMPDNSDAARNKAIAAYKKANPEASTYDAYVALSAQNPTLFSEEA